MTRPRMVIVRWWDAHVVCDSWDTIDSIGHEPAVIETVGWLMPGAKDAHVVVLLNKSVEEDGREELLLGGLAIPVEMVIEVRELEVGKRWKKWKSR